MKRLLAAAAVAAVLTVMTGVTAPPAFATTVTPQNTWVTWGPDNYPGPQCAGNFMFGTFAGAAFAKAQMWGGGFCPSATRIEVWMEYKRGSTLVDSDICYVDRQTQTVGTVVDRDPYSTCVDLGSTGGQKIVQVQGSGYIVAAAVEYLPFWNGTHPPAPGYAFVDHAYYAI